MNTKNVSSVSIVGLILLFGTAACSPAPAAAIEEAKGDFRPLQAEAVSSFA